MQLILIFLIGISGADLDTSISDDEAGYSQAEYDECVDSSDDEDCNED